MASWLTHLVRARKVQEDVAQANLAQARRRSTDAHARAAADGDHVGSLVDAMDTTYSAPAFVASAAALQAAAATHAATLFAARQADEVVVHRADDLRTAAVARGAAEKLKERRLAAARLHAARLAQRELDEVAARVHRDAAGGSR